MAALNRVLDVYVPDAAAPWPFTVNGAEVAFAIEISDPAWPQLDEATVTSGTIVDGEFVRTTTRDTLDGSLRAGTLIAIGDTLLTLAQDFSWADTDPSDPINGIAIMRFEESFPSLNERPAQFTLLRLLGRTQLPRRWARLVQETIADTVRTTGTGSEVSVDVVGQSVATWEISDPSRTVGTDALVEDEYGTVWEVQGVARDPENPTRTLLTATRQPVA